MIIRILFQLSLATILFGLSSCSTSAQTTKKVVFSEAKVPMEISLYITKDARTVSVRYRVRISIKDAGVGGGWFVEREILSDTDSPPEPKIAWRLPSSVFITAQTHGISGHLVEAVPSPSGTLNIEFNYIPGLPAS
jgi:hypothetical protein